MRATIGKAGGLRSAPPSPSWRTIRFGSQRLRDHTKAWIGRRPPLMAVNLARWQSIYLERYAQAMLQAASHVASCPCSRTLMTLYGGTSQNAVRAKFAGLHPSTSFGEYSFAQGTKRLRVASWGS